MPDDALNLTEAIAFVRRKYRIDLSPPQLYALYAKGVGGPTTFKIGKRLYMRRDAIEAWVESQIASSSRGGVNA